MNPVVRHRRSQDFRGLGALVGVQTYFEVWRTTGVRLPTTPPNMEQQDHQHDHQVTYVQINCDSGINLRS